jgi:hypothetical protein
MEAPGRNPRVLDSMTGRAHTVFSHLNARSSPAEPSMQTRSTCSVNSAASYRLGFARSSPRSFVTSSVAACRELETVD